MPSVEINGLTIEYESLGSPGYPTERGELRQRIAHGVHRSYYPAGTVRQLLAIIASGDRRPLLGKIAAPTLVIHGADDPLVPVAAGCDTAQHIKGAQLMVIDGMGHDLPPGLLRRWPRRSPRTANRFKRARLEAAVFYGSSLK